MPERKTASSAKSAGTSGIPNLKKSPSYAHSMRTQSALAKTYSIQVSVSSATSLSPNKYMETLECKNCGCEYSSGVLINFTFVEAGAYIQRAMENIRRCGLCLKCDVF